MKKNLKLKRKLDFTEDKKGKRPLPTSFPWPSTKKPVVKSLPPEQPVAQPVLPAAKYTRNKPFPPLPKSQIKIISSDNASTPSANGGQQSYPRLPPPDREYLTRKRPIPLKWTPPHKCSGFVLEDNTVMFIGTKHCEDAIRKSFINFLLGRKEDDNGSTIDAPCANTKNTVTDAPYDLMDGIESVDTLTIAASVNDEDPSGGGESSLARPAGNSDTLLPSTLRISSSKSINTGAGVGSVETGSMTSTDITAQACSVSHDTHTEQNKEAYDTSLDEELLQDPQVLKDFMCDSDASSDDSDLPRVNVTGRYRTPSKASRSTSTQVCGYKPNSGTSSTRVSADGSGPSWRGEETSFSRVDHGGKSGAAISQTSEGMSSSSGGAGGGETSWKKEEASVSAGGVAGTVENCPICHASFPPGYPQYSADEHIAMCLAVNFD